MSLLDKYIDRPSLAFLHLQKRLGCGHEGCVYTTDRNTVVKVAVNDFPTMWGVAMREAELLAAQRLLELKGKHVIVPHIIRAGRADDGLVYIEREGLNDLQLSDEGEAQFTDEVGKVLGGASTNPVPRIPAFVPFEDRQKLKALVRGYLWLKRHGLSLEDHNGSENWGLRADDTVALRDLGHIYVHQ